MNVIVRVKYAFLTDISIINADDIESFDETKILVSLQDKFDRNKFEANEYCSVSELEKYSYAKNLQKNIKLTYENVDNKVVFLSDCELRFSYRSFPETLWEPASDDYYDCLESEYSDLYDEIKKELENKIKKLGKNIKLEIFNIDCDDYNEIIGDYDDRDYDF